MNTKKYYERGKSTYLIHTDSQGVEYIKERGRSALASPISYRCTSCGSFICEIPHSQCTQCKYGHSRINASQRSQEEILEAVKAKNEAAALRRAEKLRNDSKGMAMFIMKKIAMSGDVPATKEEAVRRILKEIEEQIRDLYFSDKVKVNGRVRSALDLTKALHHIRLDPKKIDTLSEILLKYHE